VGRHAGVVAGGEEESARQSVLSAHDVCQGESGSAAVGWRARVRGRRRGGIHAASRGLASKLHKVSEARTCTVAKRVRTRVEAMAEKVRRW
jgi:hypothetical protein